MYSTIEDEEDLECEAPNEDPGDLVDFGLTVISNLGERIPGVQYIRPAKADTQNDFFAKLCRNGEGDKYFSTSLQVGEVEVLIGRSLRG